MKANVSPILVLFGLCFLASCAPSSSGKNANLECAAFISASTYLERDQKVSLEPEFRQAALIAMMTHLNKYAIPAGIGEKAAFDELNGLREELISGMAPDKIVSRAKKCVRTS